MATESDDWHFGTTGVLLVGTLAAVLFVVAYPYGWFAAPAPAAVGSLGAALAVLTGRVRKHTRSVTYYRAGLWLAFGVWATVVNLLGMSLMGFFVLGAVILATAMTAPLFTPEPDPLGTARAADGVAGLTSPEAVRWKTLIDKICSVPAPGVLITKIDTWEHDSGITLTVEGPAGSGFTFQSINDEIMRLAAAARMKPGCVPHAFEGVEHQGQAMLNVPMVYSIADEMPYPRDYSELTVNGLIPVGGFPDESAVCIQVRQGSLLMIGMPGGGKTTLLHCITAGLARCPDAIIWHIDMNNGGMSAPWLLPWLEGRCETPVVDWFAHDEAEALFMSRVALSIVLRRKAVYAKRKAAANVSLLPLGPDLPEIFIMIDEAAEVLGEDSGCLEIGENIRKIVRMGRDAGVLALISSLRPIGDHLPVQVRKSCSTRIGMRVEEMDEYHYTFENAKGIAPHMIKQTGEGFIFRGGMDSGSPNKFRGNNLLPEQIVEISVATQGRRPDLDEKSLADPKMVKLYAERWDRCADYLRLLSDEDYEAPPSSPPARRGHLAAELPPPNWGDTAVVDGDPEINAQFDEILANMSVAEPDRPGAQVRTLGEGAELIVSIVIRPMAMAQILGEVDAAGKQVTRQTVSEWVREAVQAQRLEAGAKKGQYQPAGWTDPSPQG